MSHIGDEDGVIAAQQTERELLRARKEILTIALQIARGEFVSVESRRKLSELNARYPHLAEPTAIVETRTASAPCYIMIDKVADNLYKVTSNGLTLGHARIRKSGIEQRVCGQLTKKRVIFKLDGLSLGVLGELTLGEDLTRATIPDSLAYRIADAVLHLSDAMPCSCRKIAA